MILTNTQVIEVVNKQVANWTVLYTKLHNHHWYVKGPHFFSLHEKFEELYNEADKNIDELAERLLAIGGSPVATLKNVLQMASIGEVEESLDANGMVQSIVDDFTILIDELNEGMEIAEKAGDETTADMLLAIHTSLEKHNWMLRAFLGK
ncbi:Dps family protein [Lederbergia galactosidilytica]|uniref:General stress protein n=1 Tax=Lederbergia galactosidilytica TaxID=217031 RepID=A0A177ZKH7_9BACI|nr:Dps family protein [Lederbergia galactosidilytica]KRG16103.1 general stress protein [Virgibacillus soli]OAK68083.1 general stress protein [Lederbergia galactosidilytica]